MSYIKAKKQHEDQPEEKNSTKCAAHGCPCRGTISTGGAFFCVYHHSAEPEKWPMVTEALRENEKLLMACNEVLKMSEFDWKARGFAMMQCFFDGEDHLQPQHTEKAHKRWYEARLRGWIGYLCGLTKKTPVARSDLPAVKKVGNIGQYVG